MAGVTTNSPTSSTSSSPGRTFPSTAFTITIPPNNLSSSDPSRRTEIIDSPRRKRHASLDGGHFRCRSMSSRESSVYVSPLGSSYGNDAKAINFGAKALPPSPFEERPRRRSWYKERRTFTKLIVGVAGVLLLGAMATRASLEGTEWWGARNALEIFIGSDVEAPLGCKNPYAELGRITVDHQIPEKNTWKPYDPACTPPPFLATLRKALRTRSTGSDEPLPLTLPLPSRKAATSSLPLPWLHGKTVLLFGDHVEHNHNKDFCRLSGGQFETISRDHFLSPPRFVNGIDEKLQNANQENFDGSRPAVCYSPEYDFTIISVFHFGLANRVEFERESLLEDPAFYPPVALEDRLTHIVLPVLDSLNRTQPDLIEFSTGFWDLRHFTALDKLSGQDPSLELSPEQLSWYSERLTRAFADLADAFPHTPLLWRTMHQTPEFVDTPAARVAALDALSRQIVKLLNGAETVGEARVKIDSLMEPIESSSMNRSRHEGRSRRKSFRDRANSKARFLNKVKQRIGSTERMHDVVFGNEDTSLKQMITVDEWGTLMRGQEHSANKVYTPALPGGYLWSDMMLFFLHQLSVPPHFRF